MKSKKIKRQFLIGIFLASLLNIIILWLVIFLQLSPMFNKVKAVKQEIIDEQMKKEYPSLEALEKEIVEVAHLQNLVLQVENIEQKIVISSKSNQQKELLLFAFLVKVKDEGYMIKAYPPSSIKLSTFFLRLLLLQTIIVTMIMGLAFLFTRQKIFKPVDKIITDIRNYKFGTKPIRNPLSSEFDLIQNEFVNLTDLLDEKKKEQQRIIASISHDMKTPLTSIIGYSSLMTDASSLEEIKIYNQKVSERALHMKNLLETFDDYLVNYDQLPLKLDTIQIKDLVQDLESEYKVELANKNITFSVHTKIDEAYLSIDILKLKRVFSNLISNSVRYLPKKGKITVEILQEKGKKDFVTFFVSDNGKGVDELILKQVFDPFFTTDSSRKISGLGLSICKELIEMHKGTIQAYNQNGFVVVFTIPCEKKKKRKRRTLNNS